MSAKPKSLLYSDDLAAVERRIVDALPEIVDNLITQAKGGDTKAAVYLLDRILGRAAGSVSPPADDHRAAYTLEEFQSDEHERLKHKNLFRAFPITGATKRA